MSKKKKILIQSKKIEAFRKHLQGRGYRKLLWDAYKLEIKAEDESGNIIAFDKEKERCLAHGRVFYYTGGDGEEEEGKPCELNTARDIWSQLCLAWAYENEFNPAQKWFKDLKEPKEKPKKSLILRWCPPDHDMWERAVPNITRERIERNTVNAFKSLLKSIYRRTMFPGCKQDYLYILIGAQGVLKSLLAELICPDQEWYLESISGKDLCGSPIELGRLLKGIMVAEPKELNLGQRNKEAYKSILSQRTLTYDEKYEPKRKVNRTDSMLATSNHEELLAVDTTGNRRMVIIPLAREVKLSEEQVRSLWAEIKADLPAYYWEVIQEYASDKKALLSEEQMKDQELLSELLTHDDDSMSRSWVHHQTVEFCRNRNRSNNVVSIFDFVESISEKMKNLPYRISDKMVGVVWKELGFKKLGRAVVNRHKRHMWRIPDELLVEKHKDLSLVVDLTKLKEDEHGNYHKAEQL